MVEFRFDTDGWNPPAPVLPLRIAAARGDDLVEIQGLLDSGSDVCVIPRDLAVELGLKPMRYTTLIGFEGSQQTRREVQIHTVYLITPGSLPNGMAEVLCYDFLPGERFMVVGRNLLNLWRVTLDGPNLTGEIKG